MNKPPSASAEKPSALFLAPEPPYPAIGGGPLRSASLLEYLAGRFAVHAIVFRQPGDPDPALAIPSGRVEKLDTVELPYHSKHALARAVRNAWRVASERPPLLDRFSGFAGAIARQVSGRNYQLAVIEHFWCAPYLEQLRPHAQSVVLDLHNIESTWHRSLADFDSPARAFALRRFAKAAQDLERKWWPEFDGILVTSEEEAEVVRRIVPAANITVYPNALPELAAPPRQEREEIAFSGNLEYAPNILAVRFFHHHVWPSLRRRWPRLKWKIVGKNPEAIRGLVAGDTNIELTGFVPDALASLATAQVAIVPVLAGSGTRIKILEAWAAGTPVVSTTLGAQGLPCNPGEHLLVADQAGPFGEAVSELLASPLRRKQIGTAGRKLYEARFTWPVAWRALDPIFGNRGIAGESNPRA